MGTQNAERQPQLETWPPPSSTAEADHEQRERHANVAVAGSRPCIVAALVSPAMRARHIGCDGRVFAASARPGQGGGRPGSGPAKRWWHTSARSDQHGRHAIHHDGDEEGVFAPDQIADAPEDSASERADEEAGRVSAERSRARRRSGCRTEEQRGKERARILPRTDKSRYNRNQYRRTTR